MEGLAPDESGIAPRLALLWARAVVARDVEAALTWERIASRHALPLDAAMAKSLFGALTDDPDVLIAAYEEYGRLGARVRQRENVHELRRLGRRAPRQPRTGLLTPAEAEVARLVARGLTNRRVADAASLSPKTIEAYLSRIFTKTGCRSRVELAVFVNSGALEETSGIPPDSG
jgi:DNA-binding CsgD family transcriptional regulator